MNLPSNLFDGNVSVQTFLCQPDKEIIGEILPYDFNTNFKFNTYSEISFTIDKYYNDLFDGKTKVNPYYELAESLRVIYIRGVGHFIIQDVGESEDDTYTKSVTCFSLEYSTGQKYLENFYVNTGEEGSVETMYHARQYGAEYSIDNYYTLASKNPNDFDPYERYYVKEYSNDNGVSYNYVETQILDKEHYGAYEFDLYIKKFPNVRFYWPTCPELSLLHLVFDRIPEWKIGHVDKELWYQERTFSEDRTAVYDFLYNTAAETFKFVMVWDSINGTCSFYKTEEDGVTTDTYVRTNTYNPNFIYYSDTNGTIAEEQPKNEDDVINRVLYINVGNDIETQWDTDVFISRENLASSLDIKYSTDDIKTKLKITGSDNLDVRDVNLGQNYILNLSYYNTPLWLGEDLHLKYNAYTNDLAKYTKQYKELISAWSAAYNEYSDLMNYVPAEPRVMLVGDVFEKLYCVYNKYKPASKEFKSELTYYKYDTKTLTYQMASPQNDQDLKDGQYYVIQDLSIEDEDDPVQFLVERLQTKLDTYRVDQEDDKTRSLMAKTDDVLLTLENDASDSVTIRVRYTASDTSDKPDKISYRVFRTLTMASTGISNTIEYSLYDWVDGQLTANKFGLEDENIVHPFKIKSIGTLGAYFCLVRDETVKENLEDYGIRLLQEKQDTYTKVFIAQTEGYMNEEGSQCVTSNEEPKGNEYPIGTKWLDTENTDSEGRLIMKERTDDGWITYTPDDNDYENYARFYENYTKLGNVQTVLAEKQRIADYLLNGVAMSAMHLADNDINLYHLLRAAILHLMVPGKDVYMTELGDVRPSGNIKEGSIWFHTINDGYSLYTEVKQYDIDKGWVDIVTNIPKMTLTSYDKDLGIITFVMDPTYSIATEFSTNQTYLLLKNGIYIKPQVQPTNTDELTNRYECVVNNEISGGTKCYFTMDGDYYSFDAPPDIVKEDNSTVSVIQKNSLLMYNSSTNQLAVGASAITPQQVEDITGMTELQFTKITYYVANDEEYAAYVINGTPYVSYARSQGLCLAKMNVIKEASDMNTYFDEHELVRLSPFIREDEYSDSNFLLTGYESEEEQMNIKQELLNAGEEELKKICQPKLSFNATMANILAIPEFAPLKNQFKLGNFVRVGIREGYVKRARLLEVNINLDDPSDFSATFGDLITTKSEVDKHADLLSMAVSAGKSVASNQSKWQKGADKATALEQAINNGLKDAALSVANSSGQNISWDSRGILCRKMNETTGEYYDEQMLITNNRLVATSDNWKTSNGVFGKYNVNGQDHWGVLANAVVAGYVEGSVIKGGSLEIGGREGDQGKFVVHENGSVEILASDSKTPIYATKSDVDLIKYTTKYRVELFYDNSTVFNTIGQTLKVSCKVYEGTEDITEKLPNETVYSWYLNGDLFKNTSSPDVEITNNDFSGASQLNCQITFEEEDLL